MLKLKSIIIISIMISLTLAVVSAQNETVTNTHNSDINDPKYVNPNDYHIDENESQVTFTSDAGSFNNVSMSNGYNAYEIQDGGHLKTNDSKTHPSFWNDTYHAADANDTGKAPIGEYVKILFYTHFDDLMKISPYPHIPSSIFVQSPIGDLYKNAGDTSKLPYNYTKEAVNRYNEGFRANNTTIQWLSETTYRIIDFLAFRNSNQFHKDLWGFKFQLFNRTIDNQSNVTSNSNSSSLKKNSTNDDQSEIANEKSDQSRNNTLNISSVKNRTDNISLKYQNKKFQIDSKETGNPTNLLVILIFILCIFLVRHIIKRI